MIKSEINACEILIEKMKTNKSDNTKLRNELYAIMEEYILIWMKSILKDKNFYSKEELISLSWDCFLFCLKYYDPQKYIPLPNHFFSYTKFFLLATFKKDKLLLTKEDVMINTISNTKDDIMAYDLSLFDHLDDLKMFKKSLPEEYKIVFDDALMSMADCNNKDKVKRHNQTKLTHTQYNESKKLLKIVIYYLLRR